MFRKINAKDESEIKSCFSASGKLQNGDKLFSIFMTAAQKNDFTVARYILNECFDNAEDRANFGNKQDKKGNTAYHYAAQNNCKDIIILLNDKRKFKGKQKFFQFNLENDEKQTPLDLCCLNGHDEVFFEIWRRAGKSNHNPSRSLECARQGGSMAIVAAIEKHPKVKKLLLNDKKRKRDDEGAKPMLKSSTARMLAEQNTFAKRQKVEKNEGAPKQDDTTATWEATHSSPLSPLPNDQANKDSLAVSKAINEKASTLYRR